MQHLRSLLLELLGTFFLSMALLWSGQAWTYGAVMAACLVVFRNQDCGFFNPAITLALLASRKLAIPRALILVLAQFAGAALATGLTQWLGFSAAIQSELGADGVQPTVIILGLGLLVASLVALRTREMQLDVPWQALFLGLTFAGLSQILVISDTAGFNAAIGIASLLRDVSASWEAALAFGLAAGASGVMAGLGYTLLFPAEHSEE